ncbi:protein GrpE [Bacilli bacterium]|nr:protein GrpE [Bacilli bacterium]GHU51722.1 protein GrpE [Bacilli bacterium]
MSHKEKEQKNEEVVEETKVEKEEVKEVKEPNYEHENKKLLKEIDSLKDSLNKKEEKINKYETLMQKINEEYASKVKEKAEQANATLKEHIEANNKKVSEEITNIKKYAMEKPAAELIEIISQFERALSFTPSDEKVLNYQKGFNMFLNMFKGLLEDLNINEINTKLGDEYDPKFMEAVDYIETKEYKSNHVAKIISKGYKLHDRIIKTVVVILAK